MVVECSRDRARLVGQLSPPMSAPAAERVLGRVYTAYRNQLYREHHGREPAAQAQAELVALRTALAGLSHRALDALQAAAIRDPRAQTARFRNMRVARHLMTLGTERALEEMPRRPFKRPSAVGDATLKVLHVLCVVYCRAHGSPYPTWNYGIGEPYSRAPIAFACRCLRAWHAPGAWTLHGTKSDGTGRYSTVVRALQNKYRGRFLGK
jgi:hypothetical protein